jgi:phosphatidylserine/phosphatidylglycerophosphate/cardiolipin synthase-like enzyme
MDTGDRIAPASKSGLDSPYLSGESFTRINRPPPRPDAAPLASHTPFLQELPASRSERQPAVQEFLGPMGNRLRALMCEVFFPANSSDKYDEYIAAPTTGRMTPFINGRSWGGATPKGDRVDAFDRMQEAVEGLKSGNALYVSAWMFDPTLRLTKTNASGLKTWGALFQQKARQGVKIRILMTDFSAIFANQLAGLKSFITALDALIAKLPDAFRDNLKYVVSLHPATHVITLPLGKRIAARVGTHHQKFIVVKTKDATTAFCGGLDIAFMRTPAFWGKVDDRTYRWLWHDAHCRLEGLIALDLEKEFVKRWNREKDHSVVPARPGWKPFETLALAAPTKTDEAAARNRQNLQMLRTVSVQAAPPRIQDTRRDDIWQGYLRLIGCAKTFLYMENQYFRHAPMADAIVKQALAQPELVVIVVVPSETDDLPDAGKKHGDALQHDFFSRLDANVPKDRLRIYTMFHRIIHSKFIMADDHALCLGSANANPRGFFLDTELNVMLDDVATTRGFRHRLWAHNLGLTEAKVAAWKPSEFLTRWDAVAKANEALKAKPAKMTGEAIMPFDALAEKGQRQPIIDDVETESADAGDMEAAGADWR